MGLRIFRTASELSDPELDKGLAACETKDKVAQGIPYPVALGFVVAIVFAPVFVCAFTGATFGTAFTWCALSGGLGLYGAKRVKQTLETNADNNRQAFTQEKEKRELERTPSFRQQVHEAALAAAKKLKEAFNCAVDKTFHGGTEKPVAVKKPLRLKKPGEKPRKKFPFGF